MPEFEFDVDASIAAGWERFAGHLAGLLRALEPGDSFDMTVPALGTSPPESPYLRFTRPAAGRLHADVFGGGDAASPVPLNGEYLDRLDSLGWTARASTAHVTMSADHARTIARLVVDTATAVFGLPHPVFLNDAPGPTPHAPVDPDPDRDPGTDHVDFRPLPISCPDEATRAVGAALAEVYAREMPADRNDVFTVPAGRVPLFVRAHRSLPLIVFRSPLVAAVADPAAAETEVAILNRDSLWCRYVFDGETIYAESEFVDRVFLPVNFKIQLAEVSAELDDVHADLARRVSGRRWRDTRPMQDRPPGEQ